MQKQLNHIFWYIMIFKILNYWNNRYNATMKIPADEMKLLLRPSVQILQNIFIKHKYEIRITGGAVRDLLMNKIPVDLDFATTATPSEMKNMFITEGIRLTNRYGEKHATVTACIKEENFECSTLRVDKIIDGTRKEVEFSYDWEQDANAGRDFTINALFLSFDGTIYDYVNGIQHIKERKIKFVGNPDETIQANPHRNFKIFSFF
ncbi:CCA tRNA nucleotidyltransferase 1, mitochondrial [Armadillidium nasatum]|uniref:CCA tRNA nucleotidyltransferase 1, mitochondrial n=1 Tax=Armadillidium nasatum TaxID=96803 RepID=A0A5N5TDM7_9CRUS|nr:CCA tRNA nucleotidyltransferase 1, mitochondrial [Armadillidium nasatum]